MNGCHKSCLRQFAWRSVIGRLYLAGRLLIVLLLVIGSTRSLLGIATHKSLTSPAVEACSIYASSSGKDENSGASFKSPKSFNGAAARTRPGSVVCLLGGTYQLTSTFKPPTSGTPSSWIIYRNYDEAPVKFVWAGPADASPMFDMNEGKFPSGPAYLEFRGLNLDGGGKAGDGFFCRGSHHLRFIGNTISNTGGSGIGTIQCDYVMVDHNTVIHNGYVPATAGSNASHYSWTSGISLNSNQWYDSYTGFHNIISNNIVAGEVDQSAKKTDGNGIILDLSNRTSDFHSANTPPALIINNVVYGNGGRCMEAFTVSNFWVVNNTCFRNNLDPALATDGSLVVSNSVGGYIVNNIVVASNPKSPPYGQEHSNSKIFYFSDMSFGGPNNFTYSDPSQFIQADPLFVGRPLLDSWGLIPPGSVASPDRLNDVLTLSLSSPAVGKGIDPSTFPNLSPTIVKDLRKYIYTDINGNGRPTGGPFDLGAYQTHQIR